MEKALVYELNKIDDLIDNIWPTNIPKNIKPPFLIYIKDSDRQEKTLDGYGNLYSSNFLLNILCLTYDELPSLTKKVRKLLLSLPLKTIGNGEIYIQDLNINNIKETYEEEVMLHRSIMDVTFWYREDERYGS